MEIKLVLEQELKAKSFWIKEPPFEDVFIGRFVSDCPAGRSNQ